jgi:hypothetical protein
VATDYCKRVVAYGRTRMIGNESQVLALTLATLTAYAPSPREFVSVGVLGELGSGKTRLVKIVLGEYSDHPDDVVEIVGIIPRDNIFHITSASPKALVYSKELRASDSNVKIIEAAEYQKLTQTPEIIEYLKSQSGDDGKFVYEYVDVATRGTQRITQKKRVVVFTYAQSSMDAELESRLIRFSAEENSQINQAVNAMNHGAPYREYRGFRYTLKGDPALEDDIRERVVLLAASKGGINVINPFFDGLTELEDNSRASSKRVSSLIEALFKSSSRLNFKDRKRTPNGDVLMSAQDIVNVLSLSDIVQSIVLGIDTIDLAIIRYLGMRNNRSADHTYIINHLRKAGLAELKMKEFIARAEVLENGNYLIKWWDSEGKKHWWKLNSEKYIHPLTVDWQKIYEIDGSKVENPISGEVFRNIVEFGKKFDEYIRMGLELNTAVDPDVIPTFEETVKRSVQNLISGGKRYKNGDTTALRRDCMIDLGQTSITDHDKFAQAVDRLVADGVLAVDEKSGYYVIPDPSIKSAGTWYQVVD